jgi:hypothetical protein
MATGAAKNRFGQSMSIFINFYPYIQTRSSLIKEGIGRKLALFGIFVLQAPDLFSARGDLWGRFPTRPGQIKF